MKKGLSLMFHSRVPSVYLVLLATISFGLFMLLKHRNTIVNADPVVQTAQNCPGVSQSVRLNNFRLIQPLLMTNMEEESASLREMKNKVQLYLNESVQSQKATKVSVYFKRLKDGAWYVINGNEVYNPASLSKIMYLITYLKEAEAYPEILNKQIYFAQHYAESNVQNIRTFSLQEQKNYKVRDLLYYMIAYSDNDATMLLMLNVNKFLFKQLFVDLRISPPDEKGEYFITPLDYSKFFSVLFNATYLSATYSEYALDILNHCDYNDGLKKGLDPSVTFSHKFGERILGNNAQLHEFGIVYVNNNPYLLGVMTSGTNLKPLSEILGEVSRIVATEYKKLSDPG